MFRSVFTLALLSGFGALVTAQPPKPGGPAIDTLEVLLPEGTKLDGTGFSVLIRSQGPGTPRVVIFDGDNPKHILGASVPVQFPEPLPTDWWMADFKGQVNTKSAMVYAYRGAKTSSTVKCEIVNNPLPSP